MSRYSIRMVVLHAPSTSFLLQLFFLFSVSSPPSNPNAVCLLFFFSCSLHYRYLKKKNVAGGSLALYHDIPYHLYCKMYLRVIKEWEVPSRFMAEFHSRLHSFMTLSMTKYILQHTSKLSLDPWSEINSNLVWTPKLLQTYK